MSLGPFLLGPGNYTLRLTAVDPYGRVRTLTWIVVSAVRDRLQPVPASAGRVTAA